MGRLPAVSGKRPLLATIARRPTHLGRRVSFFLQRAPPHGRGYRPRVHTTSPEPSPRSDAPGQWRRWALLAVYVIAYGGFIGVTVAAPGLLAMRVAGGVNLAVVWGFALIVLAFVVALAALKLPEGR